MKRLGCLYRVSTKKQVGVDDDIPMQKQACEEFAKQNGWIITKEFVEKGISGFKVSANDRDALNDMKEAALRNEFDAILVFMFDRLGRKEDETPFVVEWFVQHGIECWSVKEGEQKFEHHVDKLMNYIRFWQADGESRKTSERVSTRMAQLTAEGKFTGGVVPFGYKLVPTGAYNKKGSPIKELVIEEREAELVRMIFDKTVKEGVGSFRMADSLNRLGVTTHKGAGFQPTTVNRILKNRIYCGYYVSKDTVSPKQEHLVIIDEKVFEMAQNILKQRKNRNDKKNTIAMQTKGESLLSGNIFCGHCGSRLMATKTDYKTKIVNGQPVKEGRRVYICYHRSRRLNNCDGQTIYQAQKVEDVVLKIVRHYLMAIKQKPKERALQTKYENTIKAKREEMKRLNKVIEDYEEQIDSLVDEIGKSLVGRSEYPHELLKKSIDKKTKGLEDTKSELQKLKNEVEDQSSMLSNLDFYYEQFTGWAEEFEQASLERKKMILCQMFESISVSREYKIEAVLRTTYNQFFE